MNLTDQPDVRSSEFPRLETLEELRIRAFCSKEPEVFYAVAHSGEVWRPDPFDVESIHAEARDVFQRLVARAGLKPRPAAGRVLLLKGESGSGKTHLMRAFRNWTHESGRGYCAYMQMTSASEDYGRYILTNLIESLSRPYYEPKGETTGLIRLSTALAESSSFISVDRLVSLREDDLDAPCLGRLIEAMADQIVQDDRFNEFDLDLIRALLYLQRNDPRLRGRVLKYLRCEDLSPSDRLALGDLTPRTYPGASERVVALLGQIMGAVEDVPLIVCLDQLESIRDHGEAKLRFPRAMSALCNLADRVPSSVMVISCLEDLYEELKNYLTTPTRFRLEHDPAPILLSVKRRPEEVVQLIARRLEVLYDHHEVATDPEDPTFPIPSGKLPELENRPTRLILEWVKNFHERCIAAGTIVDVEVKIVGPPPVVEAATIHLEQLWNDFRSADRSPVPDDDTRMARLLSDALALCALENPDDFVLTADSDDTMIAVECQFADQSVDRLLVGLCNRPAQGGALSRQVGGIEKRTDHATPVVTPVLVRSSEFPTNPKNAITKQIGNVVARGGRRVVVEDSDWRAMQSMKLFRGKHQTDPRFAAWLVEEKPLSGLGSLRNILALDDLKSRPRFVLPPEGLPTRPAPPGIPPAIEPDDAPGPLRVGMTLGINPSPVRIEPAELSMHAAFLGAPGSGKTTVALSMIEQLLIQGIPAILIDRKGDLCRYADPTAWSSPAPDAPTESRRAAFTARADIAVYTPGNPEGRPLAIAPIPHGLGGLKSAEREKTAQYAASALGAMMNYKGTTSEQARTVILAKAMDLLGQAQPDRPVNLPELIGFIDDQDPSLVNAMGKLDTKNFARLVQDLETIRHSKGRLLAAQGEPLDAEALLGLGAHAKPGKTRLSIISTKFLGSNQDIQFWVAQFLMEMARWMSLAPTKTLRAVVLFDEADLYLPAVGKPPTKEPMEDLLKRARSAGLGLFLATQSPGDFDYRGRENIRSWFVGRVAQPTALAKMKPMLSECRTNVESKIPLQTRGQFHLLREGEVTALQAHRSLMDTEQLSETEILDLARRTR